MSKGLLKVGVLGLSALTFTLVLTPANAQERVRWKMQSAFGSQLPHLGPSGVRFSKDIERMSGGKFEVKFYEPGALIPPLECFDAVSKGFRRIMGYKHLWMLKAALDDPSRDQSLVDQAKAG